MYPVYALLFRDSGLSVGQISALFAIWSGSSLLFEVPSGVLADAGSRRRLLWTGPLLSGLGFTLWVAAPSFWAFALGFLLWGVKGALTSGALEALVYTELDRAGAAGRYARILGRARAFGTVGVVSSMALAAPVLDRGGYPAVGAASVAACLLTAAAAATFPEHRGAAPAPDGPAVAGPAAPGDAAAGSGVDGAGSGVEADAAGPGWRATLRTGLGAAGRQRAVRSALVFVVLVTAGWGVLDEYTPLLVVETGVAAATVPLLLLVVWAAVALGGLCAGPAARSGPRPLAALLALAAAVLAAGALSRRPAGIVLVAVAFGILQVLEVVAGARLQERVSEPARATVTSVAGMVTDLATLAGYAGYAGLATVAGHGGAFAVLAVPYAVVACWLLARAAQRGSGARPAR
nr:MFS transporter [Plantactinospora sp. KBS50]